MTTLIDELVPDELWRLVEPLLPAPPRPPYGGRRRVIPDRNCFAAIVYMARTSIPWRLLPARELGCGSPATCWRRLTEWAKAGVFDASTSRSWTSWGRRVGWTGHGQVWIRPACAPSVGGPHGRKSGRSWQAWVQAAPGL
jgi:transposase